MRQALFVIITSKKIVRIWQVLATTVLSIDVLRKVVCDNERVTPNMVPSITARSTFAFIVEEEQSLAKIIVEDMKNKKYNSEAET